MGWLEQFVRAHLAAAVGTALDLALFGLLVYPLGLAPTPAVALSATAGALVNFQLARHWVFRAGDGSVLVQGVLFAVGALGSIGLNTLGVHATVDWLGWHPIVGRVVVILAVAAGFNFPFQRFVVFRR